MKLASPRARQAREKKVTITTDIDYHENNSCIDPPESAGPAFDIDD
jgi:hypothetical protein